MSLVTYLNEVMSYLNNIPREQYLKYNHSPLLCSFAGSYRVRNAYEISMLLAGKNNNRPMFCSTNGDELKAIAPKNMREKLRKFEMWGLLRKKLPEVEPDGHQAWIHNANNYELTTGGIFYLLTKHCDALMLDGSLIFEHHRDNIIFKTFLYPHLKYETFRKLGVVERIEVLKYLKRCCDYTWIFMDHLYRQIEDSSVGMYAAFRWNKLPDSEHDTQMFIYYLYRRFKLKAALDVIKGKRKPDQFSKSNNGKKIMVKIGQLVVTATLDRRKGIVTVLVSDGQRDKFKVHEAAGHLFGDFIWGTVDEFDMHGLQNEMNDALSDLVASVIMKPANYVSALLNDSLFREEVKNFHATVTHNFNQLVQDAT